MHAGFFICHKYSCMYVVTYVYIYITHIHIHVLFSDIEVLRMYSEPRFGYSGIFRCQCESGAVPNKGSSSEQC